MLKLIKQPAMMKSLLGVVLLEMDEFPIVLAMLIISFERYTLNRKRTLVLIIFHRILLHDDAFIYIKIIQPTLLMLKLCTQNHSLSKYLKPIYSSENLLHEPVSLHYLLLTISLTLSMVQKSELCYIHKTVYIYLC